MTVTAAQPTFVQIPGNGSAMVFAAPMKCFAASDVVVGLITSGVYALQSSGYTVLDIDNNGGFTVAFTTAPPIGTTVDLRTATPQTQTTEFANLGQYLPENSTECFDRLTRALQDAYRQTYLFGIHGPDNEAIPWPALPGPSARRGAQIIFDPATGLPVLGVPNTQVITTTLLAPFLHYDQSAAEIAAGVMPTDFGYAPGDIRRYGPALNGTTDDTVAVKAWLSVGGPLSFPVAKTALISSACPMVSNTKITAPKGAKIVTSIGGFSLFKATSQSDISISGLTFNNTHAGVSFANTFAHVQFIGCARPTVKNCEFIGMQCGGIEFDGCTAPRARNNYLHDGLYLSGQLQSADIAVYGLTGATSRAIVVNNDCHGGGAVGIAIQDEYSGFNPSKNLISGNDVRDCLLYGILCYKPSYAALNSFDQIVDNHVENVQGVPALLSGQGGGGIYVVGSAAGGTKVAGNQIVNCCVQTTGASQATAGISIAATNGQIFFAGSVGGAISGILGNGGSPFPNGNWNGATSSTWLATFTSGEQRLVTLTNGLNTCAWSGALGAGSVLSAALAPYYNDPITVDDNKISGMTQYDGIQIASSIGGGVALGINTVNMPASNTSGNALHIRNSSNVSVVGGVLVNQGIGATVFIENQTNVTNISLTGVNISGGGNSAGTGCVEIVGDGTHGIAGLILSGLQVAPAPGGAGAAGIYITTAAVTSGQISDCSASVVTMPALLVAGCTRLRLSNNNFASSGTNTVTTSGSCAGSFFDKTNLVSGGVMNNGATGFLVDQFGPATNPAGTWGVGDTITNDFTSTTTNDKWRCTVAGSPGTWVGHV